MDWIIAAGTISLGVLIGILVGYFVNEAKKMDKALLTSAIGILARNVSMTLEHLVS